MNTRSGAEVVERLAGRADVEAAVERDLFRRDPEPVELRDGVRAGACPRPGSRSGSRAGRISPRAPRRVFSVTSQSWFTYPNSFGFPSFPLRIGRASGSDERHEPVGDRLPSDPLLDLARQPSRSDPRAPRAARPPSASSSRRGHAPCRRAITTSRRVSAIDCSNSSPGLRGQLQHLGLRLPRAATDRAGHRPQRATHRPRAIPHPPLLLLRPTSRACAPPARAPSRHAPPSPHRSGTSRRPRSPSNRSAPPAARNRFDRVASTINARVNSLTVSGPIRRVSLRTVDSSGTRSDKADPAEPAQMNRVRHLRHQRPIPPPVALLEHHQPDIRLHRDRRPPIGQHRPPGPRSTSLAPALQRADHTSARDRPATGPTPPDPPATRAPRSATPRPTSTPAAPPKASAHELLLRSTRNQLTSREF